MVEKKIKGYMIPDKYLQKRKGYFGLEEAYSRNPIIFGSVNNVRLSLFNYKQENHFEIECSESTTQRFIKTVLFNRFERGYGQSYDLEGFLRNVLQSLLIYGKVFYRIDWSKKKYFENETRWGISGLRWLPVETMKVIKSGKQIRKFKQEYSYNVAHKDLQGITTEFEPDEIFFVEWSFDKGKKGVSPVKQIASLCGEMRDFLEYCGFYSRAMYHPEDSSFPVERARFSSWEDEKIKEDRRQMKIQDALGLVPTAPMTEYYDIYQFIKSKTRIAQIRKYLLDEFNEQIVQNILKKNSIVESAKVNLVGYASLKEINDLFSKFKNQEVSNKQIVDLLIDT